MKHLNNLKWFSLGIAVCLLISFLASPTLAANTSEFAELFYRNIKITLNNAAVTPKDVNGNTVEPFVIDGTTYLPVRAVSSALGLNVSWDDGTSTVRLSSPGFEEDSASYNRMNPAPVGITQFFSFSDYTHSYSASVTVESVIRGNAAWQKISEANMTNDPADAGMEYILAYVSLTLLASNDDMAVYFGSNSFTPFSSSNTEYTENNYIVEPSPIFGGTVYAGGTLEGYVAFMVDKDDAAPKAVVGDDYDGKGGAWVSLD